MDLEQLHSIEDRMAEALLDLQEYIEVKEAGPVPLVEPDQTPGVPENRLQLALIVGHTAKAPGAAGNGLPNEYFFYKEGIEDLEMIWSTSKKVNLKVFYRDGIGIAGAYAQTDRWKADCVIELHYNAAANPAATGTETLSSGSKRSLELAAQVHKRMLEVMQLRDRGVKTLKPGDRGHRNLTVGRAPAVLIEPAFASNRDDAARLLHSRVSVLNACVDAAIEWFNA